MSVYDVAPEYIRKQTIEKDSMAIWDWFYTRDKDPRPIDKQFPVPRGYKFPIFPWDETQTTKSGSGLSIHDIFG